jgi:hypothetical protein
VKEKKKKTQNLRKYERGTREINNLTSYKGQYFGFCRVKGWEKGIKTSGSKG